MTFSANPSRTCDVETATGNAAPSPSAGVTFTIPKTDPVHPHRLGHRSRRRRAHLQWEEFDLGTAAPPNDDVAAVRPIFRSFVPLTVPSRTFPRLADILGNTATLGESMSTRNRTMTFRLTARDNRVGGGGVNWASTTVTVNAAAGPFVVTAPNTAVTWNGGSTESVTWDVANTTAVPVSCANVAIDLSTDGGITFPTSLAASTANDGTESVTVPDTPSVQARVRVACVGNVFFDIGNANFTIAVPSAPPVLDSLLPTSGSQWGGTEVTLTGTDFVSGAAVTFGGTPATLVTFNDSTSLTATTPVHAVGTVAVTVTNPDAQNSTLNAAFDFFPDLPFLDGFESGDSSRWSAVAP